MELRYGKMVNFEPVVLMLVLGALWSVRNWELSSDVRWRAAAIGLVVIGLWVDWVMYLFVIALWICSLRADVRKRRFATSILITAAVSGLIYLLRIHALRPDAWTNLTQTLVYRIGCDSRSHFTELDWFRRIAGSLGTHFLPTGCLLAIAGSAVLISRRNQNDGLRWLGWACVAVWIMDVVFLAVFQNDSYIHQYIGFYLLGPIAALAGVALDQVIVQSGKFFRSDCSQQIASCIVCVLLLGLGAQGVDRAKALEKQFQILDYGVKEPINLIPELGAEIHKNFSLDRPILCNFMPDYGPQLEYYAQHELLNNLSDYKSWDKYCAARRNTLAEWCGWGLEKRMIF